ncbi:SigE family RNA polymerase sigma factor [Amycolatopsis anabasis]|uniref:SigE family RNA polymerase sigma factor n=1 Tax=Amycolatopsis anabasis TaxID=1840409 RepID=UPI00131C43B8|nr:SigE family RNA polymerase sigma factor [Amycolatopsis anabasis]
MALSFDEFVAARLDALLRYATVLTCDPHLAQDVVQEVLLRAQQRWPRIAETDAPHAYVKRMVTNEYLSWRRRRAAREVALSLPVLDAIGPVVPDPNLQYDERDAMLARIARLPRKQRTAVVLRYYEHYTDAEIGAVLGCREGTVRSHLSRALSTLRTVTRQPALSPREAL